MVAMQTTRVAKVMIIRVMSSRPVSIVNSLYLYTMAVDVHFTSSTVTIAMIFVVRAMMLGYIILAMMLVSMVPIGVVRDMIWTTSVFTFHVLMVILPLRLLLRLIPAKHSALLK